MHKLKIFVLLLLVSQVAFSNNLAGKRQTGELAYQYKNHKLAPTSNQIHLPSKLLSDSDLKTIEQAESMFNRNAALSIVMVEKGQLVFEKYKAPSSSTAPNFSYSMSKSLTAYTVGAMSCNGKIGDLNRPAQTYSPDLKGTVYGEATVKNLLTMSSGVKETAGHGNQIWKTSNCKEGYDCNEWHMMVNKLMSGVDVLKTFYKRDTGFFGQPILSGSKFAYNNVDTLSLSNVADHNGGFIKSFEEYIWKQAGTEAPGYWLLDKDNKAISPGGFSATSRDWARLAMLTIKQVKSNDCMGKFMQDATKEQLVNRSDVGKAFRGYGYQTWIGDMGPRQSYWWLGFAGQRVGIDPVKERILVVTSYSDDYMPEIYNLFSTWQRQQ